MFIFKWHEEPPDKNEANKIINKMKNMLLLLMSARTSCRHQQQQHIVHLVDHFLRFIFIRWLFTKR